MLFANEVEEQGLRDSPGYDPKKEKRYVEAIIMMVARLQS